MRPQKTWSHQMFDWFRYAWFVRYPVISILHHGIKLSHSWAPERPADQHWVMPAVNILATKGHDLAHCMDFAAISHSDLRDLAVSVHWMTWLMSSFKWLHQGHRLLTFQSKRLLCWSIASRSNSNLNTIILLESESFLPALLCPGQSTISKIDLVLQPAWLMIYCSIFSRYTAFRIAIGTCAVMNIPLTTRVTSWPGGNWYLSEMWDLQRIQSWTSDARMSQSQFIFASHDKSLYSMSESWCAFTCLGKIFIRYTVAKFIAAWRWSWSGWKVLDGPKNFHLVSRDTRAMLSISTVSWTGFSSSSVVNVVAIRDVIAMIPPRNPPISGRRDDMGWPLLLTQPWPCACFAFRLPCICHPKVARLSPGIKNPSDARANFAAWSCDLRSAELLNWYSPRAFCMKGDKVAKCVPTLSPRAGGDG